MRPEADERDRRRFLLERDLAMLAQAAAYNLDLETDRFASNDALVKLFFSLCRLLGPDLFVEAGAWNAASSRRAKQLNPESRVVAFEANPYLYGRYVEVNRQAGVEYLHCAVSDATASVRFNVLRDEHGNAIVNGRSSILRRRKVGDEQRGFEECVVDGVALDDFFAGYAFDAAAVWIDVEGAAGRVLPGAERLLAKSAVVIVEVEERNWWGPEHWCRDRVESYLYDRGLVPVARDFQYRHQYNVLFVRAELLTAPSDVWWSLARFSSRAYAVKAQQAAERAATRRTPPGTLAGRAVERLRPVVAQSAFLRRALGR